MNPFTAISDLITMPFGLLMKVLYDLFNNYAFAIFFFALVVKIVLIPLGIQQQKSQIRMAKIKPKEQAIRGKYAGRTDSVTQQKVQTEVLEMYKSENYSPMSGCLPLLIQMPVIFVLYNIIRNPLTYIDRFSPDLIDKIKQVIFDSKDTYSEVVASLANMTKASGIQQIDIVRIFNNPEWLNSIRQAAGIPDGFKNLNFGFFGQMLTTPPVAAGLSILLIIPVLNFAASFLQMKMTKVINANNAATADVANNKGMKIMEYAMPLLVVYMSYQMNAALGLYWIFQSVLGIAQMFVLAKLYPIPKITEEEYELARQQYGGTTKKKKKKPAAELESRDDDALGEVAGLIEADSESDKIIENLPDIKEEEKYISKTIPKGINPNIKNNYQKTGKKYTINKRKK